MDVDHGMYEMHHYAIYRNSHLYKPFVDEGHPSHNYFPAWQYAIKVPLLIMIVGLSAIFTFLSLVMIKSKKRSL